MSEAVSSTPSGGPRAAAHPGLSFDGGSELVDSLLSGMPEGEQHHLLEMIQSTVEAERAEAMEGNVRRQVDVGTRRRSARRDTDGDGTDGGTGAGDDDLGDRGRGD